MPHERTTWSWGKMRSPAEKKKCFLQTQSQLFFPKCFYLWCIFFFIFFTICTHSSILKQWISLPRTSCAISHHNLYHSSWKIFAIGHRGNWKRNNRWYRLPKINADWNPSSERESKCQSRTRKIYLIFLLTKNVA